MNFHNRFSLGLLGILLAAVASNAQAHSSDATPEARIISAFRAAHDYRDMDAAQKLFCWDRVTPELRKMTEDGFREAFDEKIASIRVTKEHPKGRLSEYVRDGVTYRFNLSVVAELVVENQPLAKEGFSGTYYPLGMRDGQYLIAVMAPAEGAAERKDANATAPAPAPDGAIGPANTGAKGKTQAATVPAKTSLMVRLNEDVGLKTIATGGHFSGTLAEAVAVGGSTAIPTGAAVRGVVTKTGEYSPQVELTSVTVNGKPQKISTVSRTFNEGIVFPAGSSLEFTLLWPLQLN